MSDIVCFGSCNIDLITYTEHMPKIGETIKGLRFDQGFGGKGANQAVMAAKLGAKVAMIGMLGEDVYGKSTRENFAAVGVDASCVGSTRDCSSGIATIMVDASAHNCIIIVPGANDLMTPARADSHRDVIRGAKVLLTQLEVSLDATIHAMRLAKQSARTKVFFNPAPADKSLPAEIYSLCDVVLPNETEAELLTGVAVVDVASAERAAHALQKLGAKSVIVTLGANGCVVVADGTTTHVKSEKVRAIDSTGAGDCFVGTLAWCVGNGMSLLAAAELANKAAAQSVTKPGTQKSYPTLDELRGIYPGAF